MHEREPGQQVVRDGLWADTSGHGESVNFWMGVLTEIKNRGVADVFLIIATG